MSNCKALSECADTQPYMQTYIIPQMHTDIYNIYVYTFFFASQRFNHSEIHLTTLAFISPTLHYTQCLLSTCLSVCVWKFCVLIYRKSLVIHSNCHFPAFSPFNFRACPAFFSTDELHRRPVTPSAALR